MRLTTAAALALLSSTACAGYAEVHLQDCMDEIYGAGSWSRRSAAGVGTDAQPALLRCVQHLRAQPAGRGHLIVDPGPWLLSSQGPDYSGIILEGYGSQASTLVYNLGTGAAVSMSGAGGYTGGGARRLSILLEAGWGMSSAYALLLRGDATYQPDQTLWEDLYVSSEDPWFTFWYQGLQADGTARTSPQGIRISSWHNVQFFNAWHTCAWIGNAVGWDTNNLGCYTGVGTGNDLYVTGGSTSVTMARLNVGGQLHIQNTLGARFEGSVGSAIGDATTLNASGWLATQTVSGVLGAGSDIRVSGHYATPSCDGHWTC